MMLNLLVRETSRGVLGLQRCGGPRPKGVKLTDWQLDGAPLRQCDALLLAELDGRRSASGLATLGVLGPL